MKPYKEMHRDQKSIPKGGLLMSDYITRERNLTLLTDYYEYTMVNGYFHAGIQEKIAVFDVFFRRVPENGGFAIYAGLQQIIELINGLSFTEEDIEYLSLIHISEPTRP